MTTAHTAITCRYSAEGQTPHDAQWLAVAEKMNILAEVCTFHENPDRFVPCVILKKFFAELVPCAPTSNAHDDLVKALQRLENGGWLRHIEEQAISVKGSGVATDVLETVAICRAALAKAGAA